MGISKVDYYGTNLVDLTSDTVDEESVLNGYTFHGADGEIKNGKVVVAEVIDNLTSTSATDALSANQGRILDTKIPQIIEVTRADYDEHKEEYESTNNFYKISDEDENFTADKINYDNTTSKLTSDNVQGAIDEVVASINIETSWSGTKEDWESYDKTNLENGAEVIITNDYDNQYAKVDEEMSTTSTYPLQNKVITTKLSEKQDKLIPGDNITIAADGKTISATGGGSYTLPIASDSVLGGIKVGTGLFITADGVLSVSYGDGDEVSY